MCQLNLYMVPKSVPKEEVISIFEKHNLYIIKDSYYKFNDLARNYEFYSANSGCDCSSIISRLREENVSNFNAYKIRKKNEEIEKLNKMKRLKTSKEYDTKVKEFENQRDKLWDVLESFSKHIDDYETEEQEKIFKSNLKQEEQIKMIHEILYPKVNEMYKTLEKNKEYQNALKEYQNYIIKNTDLNYSIYYDIKEKEKTVYEYDFSDFYEQFSNLKDAFIDVLKLAKEIYIYPFWQDEDLLEIKDERQVMIENLNIEDLIFLPYKNLLQIEAISK